jgi:hypothetical protein
MISSFFLVSFFWSIISTGLHPIDRPCLSECDSLKVSDKLQATGNAYTLDIMVEGGKDPIKVILTKERGPVISDNKFEERHFISLKPGTYYCTVIDANNCKRNLEITIP